MNERERPQDPAEGQDDPNEIDLDDVGEAMPGAGRMNESTEEPGTTDPDLRPGRQAPLP